jgi:ABC-type nitrate/sulfonate/bicarbonate transport system ATPase subunit
VFQDPTLFPWATVWKNVATGLEARGVLKQERAGVDSALALVELSAFADAYPHQFRAAWPSGRRWRVRW